MEFSKQIKDEFDARITQIENLIAKRGVGSKQLKKARKTQRDVNLAILAGSLITLTGITVWAISRLSKND